jgi:hypothetical protein
MSASIHFSGAVIDKTGTQKSEESFLIYSASRVSKFALSITRSIPLY